MARKAQRTLHITLQQIRDNNPCLSGWRYLLRNLPAGIDYEKPLSIDYLAWHVRHVWDLQWIIGLIDEPLSLLLEETGPLVPHWVFNTVVPLWTTGYHGPDSERKDQARRVRRKSEMIQFLDAFHKALDAPIENGH